MDINNLTPSQLAALRIGDIVLAESQGVTSGGPDYRLERVTQLTPKRIITTSKARGHDVTSSYRRTDGVLPFKRQGARVALVDPDHPDTVERLGVYRRRVARERIDRLHREWQRDPEDLDKARQLRARLADYLTKYDTEADRP